MISPPSSHDGTTGRVQDIDCEPDGYSSWGRKVRDVLCDNFLIDLDNPFHRHRVHYHSGVYRCRMMLELGGVAAGVYLAGGVLGLGYSVTALKTAVPFLMGASFGYQYFQRVQEAMYQSRVTFIDRSPDVHITCGRSCIDSARVFHWSEAMSHHRCECISLPKT